MPVQDWISMVAAVVAALGAVVILPWWLRGKFAEIDRHLDRLEGRMAHLETGLRGLARIVSTLVGILIRSQVIKGEDAAILVKESIAFEPVLGYVGELKKEANPVTPAEMERVRGYVKKAQRGEVFSSSEAEDFFDLSKKLSREKENEGGWLLEMLAGLILGIYLGSKGTQRL